MDVNWMRTRLEHYLRLCESVKDATDGNPWNELAETANNAAIVEIPTVTRIVQALDPDWVGPILPPSRVGADGEVIVRQALGSLRNRDEWAIRLAPDSPSVRADRLHPEMWRAAATVWTTGEFKTAVQQAAVSLSAHIKSKAGSHLNDRELVQQVFASDLPKAGQVRLHFPGNPSDKNWQSRQQGLHLLAQGAFAGIRNIAVHDDRQWTEHEALEHLAVLSVVARWADETVVVSV